MKESRIELIDNKGPNNMRDELRRGFQNSSRIDIAVAFLNSKGLESILSEMTKALGRKNSCIRILTRISKDAFNEPAALRILMDLNKDYEERLTVKTTRLTNDFHEKLYIFKRPSTAAIFIGSSNLTKKALEREGELNIKITAPLSDEILKQSIESFNEYWDSAEKLTDARVDAYASFYSHIHSKRLDKHGKRLWYAVAGMMRKREAKKAPEPIERKVWLDYINGSLKDKTERIIKEYTSWDRFLYYACGPNAYGRFNRNDILILADYVDNRLLANCVKSKAKTRKTPDGRYFVAYQKIRNSKYKRISKDLVSYMRSIGVIDKANDLKPSSARLLSGKKLEQFAGMLNFKT